MKRFFKHLRLIIIHRYYVFKLCCKCGLFWRGLVHDLSKFSRIEFWEGVKYCTGKHSPIGVCRKQKGYSNAWINHKNKNKHHFEYWYDAENEVQINMPYKYAVESICDMIAASKCYNGKQYKPEMVLNYWLKGSPHLQTNINIENFFTKVFTDLAELGENQVLKKKYMKATYNYIVLNKK